MAGSRRDFLAKGSMGLMGAAMAAKGAEGQAATPAAAKTTTRPETPGAPPAFGTAGAVGPEVSAETFVQAEKLVQVKMTPKDLEQAAGELAAVDGCGVSEARGAEEAGDSGECCACDGVEGYAAG